MIPKHIAIIMDGNGRWAEQKGMPRIFGHQSGVSAVRKIVEAANKFNIKYLTLFTFSIENWNRPRSEIDTLMGLLVQTLKDEFEDILKNNIKLNAIGELNTLPDEVKNELYSIIHGTKDNTGMVLTLALSYGENKVFKAVKEIADKVKNDVICLDNFDDSLINDNHTKNLPDVDLLIRTSGEQELAIFYYGKLHMLIIFYRCLLA